MATKTQEKDIDFKRCPFFMPLPYCVYILISKVDGFLYIGFTKNLRNRFNDHRYGRVKSTKERRPLTITYLEFHTNKKDAERRERYFKTTKGKKAIRLMIREGLKDHLHNWFL